MRVVPQSWRARFVPAAVVAVWCVAPASAQDLTRRPYLQNVTGGSTAILWETDLPSDSVVEYGPTVDLGSMVGDPARSRDHTVVIGGLSPATTYHYRVISDGKILTAPAEFRTANPQSDTSFDFVAFGDSGTGREEQYKVAAVAESIGPRFILHAGHIVNGKGRWEDYDPQFFEPYAGLIPEIPLWPVLADHDYFTENAAPYFYTFHLPANNQEGTEQYYSFDYGNAHFLALNIELDFSPGSPQFLWLVNELKYRRRPWNFAYIHAAPYSSSIWGPAERGDRMRTYLSPLFEIYGVDVVYCGAKHHYERFVPITQGEADPVNGVTYVVCGGGGQNVTPVYGTPLTAYFESVNHLTHTTVEGDHVTVDAVRSDGTLMDSFSLDARDWSGPLVSVADEDRVLYLPFDECAGDGVHDASIHGQDGFLGAEPGPDPADPSWDADSPLSGCGALRFDPSAGDQYVTIPNDDGLFDPDDDFTVMAWVRYAKSKTWGAVASGGDYRYALYLSTDGSARGYLAGLTPAGTGATDAQVPADRWNHVALVYEAGQATLYIGGVESRTTFHGGTPAGEVSALYIGWDGDPGDGLDGWIDEVKVYRRALEAQEVRAEMVATLAELDDPPPEPPTPARPPIGPDDLVCRLAFDEPGGQAVLDASSRGNDGWLGTGSDLEAADPERTALAKYGAGALQFDGVDDLVSVPDLRGDLDLDDEWTAMAWVLFDDSGPWRPILAGGDYEYGLYLADGGGAKAYFRNLDPVGTGVTRTSLSPGRWHHVVLVKGGEGVVLYLDGNREPDSVTLSGSISPVSLLRIGHDGYPGDFFHGRIDEVKIYRRALLEQEVHSEMNSTFGDPYDPPAGPPPPPGPAEARIAVFRFEEGSGQTVLDSSGHGRDGYLGESESADGADPLWFPGGGVGGSTAISFDGADRVVTIPDTDGALDLEGSFTVMAWVRYDSATDWSAILSGGAYRYALYLTPDARTRAYFRDLAPKATPLGSATLAPGVWTHVALTKDGDAVRMFAGGLEVGSSTHGGAIAPVDRLRIGFDGYAGDGFHGRIDEVRLYDRALTAEEIQEEMAN